jgi:hypothetical protein
MHSSSGTVLASYTQALSSNPSNTDPKNVPTETQVLHLNGVAYANENHF